MRGSFPPRPLPNHIRGNISGHGGRCNAHTRIHKGDGRFFASETPKKRAIRSSSRCLFRILSHTHPRALKVTQHCCFLTGGEALMCTRQREILAAEINVYFSAVSISNCSLFSLIVEKTSQRRCEIAEAKALPNKTRCFIWFFSSLSKKSPREVSRFCVQTRTSWRYFFFSSHTLYSTPGSVSGNCYISSETSVDVTSHWPLKCISCYVLCFVWLLQGATADRFQARHKKRALVYSESMIHETKNAYSYGQQIGGVYHEKNCEQLHSF